MDKEIARLESAAAQRLFRDFGQWLLVEMEPQKAALKLRKFTEFFVFIEQNGGGIPSYWDLLRNYEPEGLRRMQSPMRWLEVQHGVVADPEMREEFSERRRIAQMFEALPPGPAVDLLASYQAQLNLRVAEGKLALRSLRLGMGVARDFLALALAQGRDLPDQRALDRFLLERPGHQNSIKVFLTFLAQAQGLHLAPTIGHRAIARARRRRLEQQLQHHWKERDIRSWIVTGMTYFHGLRIGKKRLNYSPAIEEGQAGYLVEVLNERYWIPSPIGE